MNALRDAVRRLRPADVAAVLRAGGRVAPREALAAGGGREAALLFWPSGVSDGRPTPLTPPTPLAPVAPPATPFWPVGELRLPSRVPPPLDRAPPSPPPSAEPPLPAPPKSAARLIVIRRRKMKKHQRRKLWKRMRHRWARVKQRRRQIKEKVFQNELLAMMKQAEEFSAEQHVQSKLEKAQHVPLPTRWRHKRLPEFIIRQLLGLDKKVNYKHNDVYKA